MLRFLRSLSLSASLAGLLIVGSPLVLHAGPVQQRASQSKSSKADQGNPDVKVWVNTKTHVYHCPGTRYYGKTKQGQFMTQAEAQKEGDRPAYGKVCR